MDVFVSAPLVMAELTEAPTAISTLEPPDKEVWTEFVIAVFTLAALPEVTAAVMLLLMVSVVAMSAGVVATAVPLPTTEPATACVK